MSSSKHYYGDEFPIGSVVYFVRHTGHHGWVDYGIVAENRTEQIYVDLLEPKTIGETIDDVPIEQMQFPTRWQKLPKGWSYDTELFVWFDGYSPEGALLVDEQDPENILAAYQNGSLVRSKDVDHVYYEAEIDAQHGWRIVRKQCHYTPPYSNYYGSVTYPDWPTTFGVLPHQLYTTWGDANAVLEAERAELNRQANLSDEDWSRELIDHDIARWAKLYNISEQDVNRAKGFFDELERIDEVESRVCGGYLQWKREKNKRWANVLI